MPDPLDLDRPLRGLRVVDTTDATSWSSARLLADLGADVIRVETPDRARRRALRDAQRQQALGRPRGRRRAPRAARRTPTSGSRPATRASTSPTCDARARSSWSCRSPRSAGPARTPTYEATHAVVYALCGQLPDLPAPRSSAAAAARTARVRGRVGDGRVLRAGRGVEPRGHRARRPSRPLDPRGDDPDHRHAGRGRERASLRARRCRSPARRRPAASGIPRFPPPTGSSDRWS